ncbi:hypothetical protein SCLCIDRAFT_23474 [Scleroderma citrinum Foug A]|uniref:Retroviral polymerase SH3-like domain-containing protein n=1 Tax=Scleroderma citrinum Foug A TaxID=1036808 RepID=A0A0C3AHQ2_9AGAM|nr:hypothetical protein SCLCIDRAFT_23474 [Scleroderma citrinum Foug A]
MTPNEVFYSKKPNHRKLDAHSADGILCGFERASKAYKVWIPSRHKFVASHDVIVYERTPDQSDPEDPDPSPTAPSEGVPTPTTAPIEGVTTGNNNQTSTQNTITITVTGEDSTPPPSDTNPRAAQPAPTPSKPAPSPGPMPKPPQRSEHITRPSWIKEANDKQKAKDAKAKADRRARRETQEAHKQPEPPPEPEITPLAEPTAIGNIAQTAYLAAHGQDIPRNFREATTGPDADQWWKAMNEEIAMLQRHGTWKLVDRPKGQKVIGSHWTYTIKYGPDGEILRYKA